MHILMTNIDLTEIGGTQVWVETMARQLKKEGHDIDIFSPRVGAFARDRLSEFTVMDKPITGKEYDLCLVNHNVCLTILQYSKIGGPKVYTCHGPSHRLEAIIPGADHYVAVSEEIAEKYAWVNPDVILNPVDMDRFKSFSQQSKFPPRVLVCTKNAGAMRLAVAGCELAGMEFYVAHYRENPIYDIHELIPQFDIVITSGRGVYETLSCNRSALIVARRLSDFEGWEVQADGWVTEGEITDLVRKNCSGRTNVYKWDSEDIAEALKAWGGPEPWGREWVGKYHDVAKVTKRYLEKANVEAVA